MLLERERASAALDAVLHRVVTDGDGELVVVAGEAGVGKTSLVRAFGLRTGDVEVWWGGCDNLRAPRPLGPLLDVAHAAGPAVADALRDGASRAELFDRVLNALSSSRDGVVFVVEDAHWADDATLDFVRFVGRRLDGVRAMVIVTYRADEVGPRHPLRAALGDLGGSVRLTRIPLDPLSSEGVAELAATSDLDSAALFATTGGNPFFVTEILAADEEDLPGSVRDAVLARAGGLSDRARCALDGASVVPGHADLWMVEAIVGAAVKGVDECVERGLLVAVEAGVKFRHELARLVILDSIPPAQRRELHRLALAALDGRVPAAQLAHHAAEAGDHAALVEHALRAATDAIAVGSHRAAVEHLLDVYGHADLLTDRDAAEVADTLAAELAYVGRYPESVEIRREAVSRWRTIGDRVREGESLLGLASPLVMLGSSEHDAVVAAGVAVLADLGPSCALANALTARASSHMLARELKCAVDVGDQAIALAEQLRCDDHLAHALIQVGVAQLMAGDTEAGLQRMARGRELAEQIGAATYVALYLGQLGSGAGEIRRYDLAVPALHDALDWCEPRDLRSSALYATAWLSRCELAIGEWDQAGDRATQLLALPSCTGIARFAALLTLGMLRARRGDPGVWEALDEALVIARETEHLQRLWPVAAARAEAAWLEDRIADEIDLVDDVFALASHLEYPWAVEELAWWSSLVHPPDDLTVAPADSRARGSSAAVGEARTPFGLQLAGRMDEAAAAWSALGSPYEAAAARLSGDVAQQQAAFVALDQLGAEPLLRRLAAALRDAGERVPRRASATTRANPFALTRRELDVLALVAEGRTNAEIANDLFISAKTVDHHVSNILSKLRVSTRREASREARRLGILDT